MEQVRQEMRGAGIKLRRYLLGIMVCVALVPMALAANNFVSIKLPHGVQIDLPRNWKALSENQRITLDSAVQSRNERAQIFDASSDSSFGANYYDETGKTAAAMNVRYYPESKISQPDAHAAENSNIRVRIVFFY